jgi:hypothetical protein
MVEEGKREFWKYAVFTLAASLPVGHMFYTMWLNGTWRYASELTSSVALVPDGPAGVIDALLFGFGLYFGFLLVFMQNRRKYYQGVILLLGTVGAVGLLAALGIGLPGFEPTPLNAIAFVAGLAVVVLTEMIETEIGLPFLGSIALEGRLHQIDFGRSSWGHAVDAWGDELEFPIATYGLIAYIVAVVIVSNAMNFLVASGGVGALQVVHAGASVLFFWVMWSFLTLNPSSDNNLQVLGPTSSGKTYFVLAAALEAKRHDRFEMTRAVGWINELIEDHKDWAHKNRNIKDQEMDWDISYTGTEEIYQTNFTIVAKDRIPKALHFNVIDHAGELLVDVADRVGGRAVADGGTDESGEPTEAVCPSCSYHTIGEDDGTLCPECHEDYLVTGEGTTTDTTVSTGEPSEEVADESDGATITADDTSGEVADDVNTTSARYTASDEDDTSSEDAAPETDDGAEIIDGSTGDETELDGETESDDGERTTTGSGITGLSEDESTEGSTDDDRTSASTSDETGTSVSTDGTAGRSPDDVNVTDSDESTDEESLNKDEVVDRLEQKVLKSDTLVMMLDSVRLIGGQPAGPGSESLGTTEMNRIINGVEPERVVLVATKADVLIDDWKQWHRTHRDGRGDHDRLPAPHALDEYQDSFQEYVTERFDNETGTLFNNADVSTVYPVYFETQRSGPEREGSDDAGSGDEWVPAPNANGELQPHGHDRVLAAIARN